MILTLDQIYDLLTGRSVVINGKNVELDGYELREIMDSVSGRINIKKLEKEIRARN